MTPVFKTSSIRSLESFVVLWEFFTICLMKTLQLLPLFFVLLSASSGSFSHGAYFAGFRCDEKLTAECGKDIHIACKSNHMITNMTVTFCSDHTKDCPSQANINTFKNIFTDESGRISLKINNSSAHLNFKHVQILDQRYYRFFIKSDRGHKNLSAYLKVFAPYTEPQVKKENDTIVCKASGGYPVGQIYWFSSNGTNLTHNSEFVSEVAENGSFTLTSTLQLKSLVSEMMYCCTLNNTNLDNRNCITLQGPTTMVAKIISEKSTAIPLTIVVLAAGLCVVAVIWYKKKKKGGVRGSWASWPGDMMNFNFSPLKRTHPSESSV